MPRHVGRYLARDPVFERLERQMDEIVERLFRRQSPATYQRAWAPHVDVYEMDDEFVAVAELAGVEPGTVTIEIEGEMVAIKGQRASTSPPGCSAYLQLEIPFGEFERVLVLPSSVDAQRAKAQFDDGMLTVHLPKAPTGPRRVQVEIQRSDE